MTKKNDTYKQLSEELDEVLAKLQSEELDVDEAMTYYERGMEIVQQLEAQLKVAENKVTKIKADFDKP